MIKDYKDVILGEIEVARVIAREIMLVDCELKDEEYKTEEDFATEQIRKVLNETLPKNVEKAQQWSVKNLRNLGRVWL